MYTEIHWWLVQVARVWLLQYLRLSSHVFIALTVSGPSHNGGITQHLWTQNDTGGDL